MIAPEIAKQVIDRVFGGEAVRAICSGEGKPCSESSFYKFVGAEGNEEFAEQYARAIIVRAEQFAEDIIEIGDNVAEETAAIAKAKLRTDSRKWLMSKMAPKKYGDRQSVELTGKDGGAIETKVYDSSDAGRAKALQELLDAARARAAGTPDSNANESA